MTPLHVAARWLACRYHIPNCSAMVRTLLDAGADPEARQDGGMTPLHLAARWNTVPEVVAKLLDAGADPQARTHVGETPGSLVLMNDALDGTEASRRLTAGRASR